MQLREFVNTSKSQVKSQEDRNPSQADERFEFSNKILPTVLPQIYSILNASLTSDNKTGSVITEILDDIDWVWVDGQFVSPAHLAFSCLVNASPYLHQVPADMLQYAKLLSTFRIKSSFGVEDYIEVRKT